MVIIESVIKTNPLGRWYIELRDTTKEVSEENVRIVCLDINEYAHKIELIGEEYGGEIEVAWSTEDNVTPAQINEVRQQIMAYEAQMEALQNQSSEENTEWTPNL